jgi:acetyl-CoA synthetase
MTRSEPYAWVPTDETAAAANSTTFARAHAIGSYDELLQRTIEEPEWFWDAIVQHLKLTFDVPYTTVLDASRGIPWAQWFVDGQLNLAANCVDRHARSPRAERDAIRWMAEEGPARCLTYAELADLVASVSGGLQSLGVVAGDRVAIVMPSVPEAIAAWYAIVRLGAVVVPMFSGYAAPAIRARLEDCDAVGVITSVSLQRRGRRLPLADTVSEACRGLPSIRFLVIHGADIGRSTVAPRRLSWEELLAPRRDDGWQSVPSEHPLTLCYTSGTTGRPKGAVHVHAGFLVKTAQETFFQADLHDGDALFWLSDMGWIMAPWAFVGTHAAGQTVVLYDGAPDYPGPDRLWALAERAGVTFFGLSPSLTRALMPHGAGVAHRHNLSRLRLFGSAGEPWTSDAWWWLFAEVGGRQRPIINLSGGTEVASSFLSCDVAMPTKPCSLGRPALGMAVDVVDEGGRPLREEIGELVCRQPWPSMTRGIWRDDERYLDTYWRRWPGLWVHGDWASVDEDGAWFLHGRSDDTLNVGGKRISSAEYEAPLLGHPAVREACAVGVAHDVKGETAWCFVVLAGEAEGTDELREQLAAHVAAELGKAFRPGRIGFVSQLPKTRSGKTVRRAVRAIVAGGDPGDVSVLEDSAALEAIRDAA